MPKVELNQRDANFDCSKLIWGKLQVSTATRGFSEQNATYEVPGAAKYNLLFKIKCDLRFSKFSKICSNSELSKFEIWS